MLQIIGKGGFAREVASYYSRAYRRNTIMGEYEEVDSFTDNYPTIVAIGDPRIRKAMVDKYPNLRYEFFHKGVYFEESTVGKGSIICPGTIITVNVTLGKHVIVNLNCTIGHDCTIGDYTTISPGANVSGNVHIGSLCYIGSNAVIREGITICDEVTIGAGAVIVKNITEPGTYVGNPTRKLEKNLESVD